MSGPAQECRLFYFFVSNAAWQKKECGAGDLGIGEFRFSYREELEQRGYLKIKPMPSTGGRKPSPKLLLNPLVLNDETDTSPAEETSVSSVTDEDAEYLIAEREGLQQEAD
jgi:hypothetical protein